MAKTTVTAHALDFTNVKDGGGQFTKKHHPEGDYRARIKSVTDAMPKDKDDKTPMWLFTLELVDKKNSTYPYYCKLQENQLWKVRNLFQAAGVSIPKKRVKLDPTKVVGKLIGVTLEDDEYKDKVNSTVEAVIPASDVDGEVVDEEEDDADDSDDDGEELEYAEDRGGLKAYIKAKELDVRVTKSMSDDDIRAAIKAAEESDDDSDDDDDDDEEPEPPKKSKKKKAKAEEVDDEDLDELDLDDL